MYIYIYIYIYIYNIYIYTLLSEYKKNITGVLLNVAEIYIITN